MTDGSDDELYDRHRPRARETGSRETGSRERASREENSNELQQAVERFEEAVQELVGSATTEFSDKATSFLNETTAKLERELGGIGRNRQGRSAAARMAARRRARARYRSERVMERSPRLCRDDENAKIVGVCAGIANYYGVEAWVVRCIAVTGLLFFGSIVFPAYWIMYFVMDDPDSAKRDKKASRRSKRRRPSGWFGNEEAAVNDGPGKDRNESPGRSLKGVQGNLQEVELRLRRMETHVTSGQYELQRELHKIEAEDPPADSVSR